MGEPGTGKTAFIDNMMKKYITLTDIAITPSLSASNLQAMIIQAVVQQKKQASYKIAVLQKSLAARTGLCFSDLHLANADQQSFLNSCHPVHEVLQHLICHHMIADSSRNWSEKHLSIHYLASCTPEGYWNLPVTLTGEMCLLPFFPPSDKCLQQILTQSFRVWLSSSSVLTDTKLTAQVSVIIFFSNIS